MKLSKIVRGDTTPVVSLYPGLAGQIVVSSLNHLLFNAYSRIRCLITSNI